MKAEANSVDDLRETFASRKNLNLNAEVKAFDG